MNNIKKILSTNYLIPIVLISIQLSGCYNHSINSQKYPITYEEAVEDILSNMTNEEKEQLRDTPKESLNKYHFSLGLYIRNELGLWKNNKALLYSCAKRKGVAEIHPDDASMIIIEGVWESLQ